MSFIEDTVTGLFGGITGSDAADAAEESAAQQAAAATEAIGFQRETRDLARADLAPFLQFGAGQIPQAESLLFDPQAQFDFVQNNPFAQQAIQQGQQSILNLASARGRTTAGDTQQSLSQNLLLSGLPFLQNQQQNLLSSIQLGQAAGAGTAAGTLQTGASIADLITGRGASLAAGTVGASNARQQGINNLIDIAGTAAAFSDRRLKRNIVSTGNKHKGHNTYYYKYLWSDDVYLGVMADEVKLINPGAVITTDSGFDSVNYGAL